MTRKEEIRQEANRKYPYEGGIKGMICENSIPIFIQGAEWADKTMIDKVCDWIHDMALDYMQGDITDVKWEAMFADLRKYVENGNY